MINIERLGLSIKYTLKKFKFDIITFIAAVITLWISEFVDFFYNKPELLGIIKGLIILTSSSVIIYLRSRDRHFYYIPLSSRSERDHWIGRGVFEYDRTNHCYVITNSEPGFIYARCLDWSDYEVTFMFRIVNNNMSVLLRAINLSNCVMLQFQPDGIRPHIRINGAWNWWEHKEVNLTFETPLSLDRWYKCKITCSQDNIGIHLFDEGKSICEREWKIPMGAMMFKYGQDATAIQIPFSINLEYGSIGFRNADKERCLIRDVIVQKI